MHRHGWLGELSARSVPSTLVESGKWKVESRNLMPAPVDDAAIVDTATVVQRYVRGRENQISPPEQEQSKMFNRDSIIQFCATIRYLAGP
jgi:hypothetical protein